MPRYKLTLEYDGTPFVGWQMQENGPSVQARLAEAIKAFSGEETIPRGAGRTDAGVHALGQVAHFDLAKDWPAEKVRDALNAQLRPDPITVLACELVPGFRRALLGHRAPLSLPHHRSPHARWRSSATAPGVCSARSTPSRHARGGAGARRPSRLHAPSAPPSVRRPRR